MAHAHAQSLFGAVKPVTPVLLGERSEPHTLGCSIEISRDISESAVALSM